MKILKCRILHGFGEQRTWSLHHLSKKNLGSIVLRTLENGYKIIHNIK